MKLSDRLLSWLLFICCCISWKYIPFHNYDLIQISGTIAFLCAGTTVSAFGIIYMIIDLCKGN